MLLDFYAYDMTFTELAKLILNCFESVLKLPQSEYNKYSKYAESNKPQIKITNDGSFKLCDYIHMDRGTSVLAKAILGLLNDKYEHYSASQIENFD